VGDDLFAAAADEAIQGRSPLAVRLRPQRLDDVLGQDHLLAPGRPLRELIESDRLSSVVLWGPPGTGKTTLARLVAVRTEKVFEELSAVSATVKEVREIIAMARQRLGERGVGTILFLDEVHRFNKAQQDTLLPAVEDGLIVLIGATTENPHFEVNPPLMSRSTLFRLRPLDDAALDTLIRRGLDAENAEFDEAAVTHIAARSGGDGRHALISVEVAIALATRRDEPVHVTLADAESAVDVKAVRYGSDGHFDVISAFIKSIRGSDADAGLYWLARMLEAGEDARFIARRLVILASEDIGMADSSALVVADAAARAVEFVGLPEAQLNLAHAVVHLATAPKSNRVTTAIGRAIEDARAAGAGAVPAHLRDSHYKGAAALGHGSGYLYPHDERSAWVDQQYRPDEVVGNIYYEPSTHGAERDLFERWPGRNPEDPEDPES
jgi:putative ATPase